MKIPKDRNIAIRISNEKEFNYVKNYCQQKYKNNKFDLEYHSSIKWIYINQIIYKHYSFFGQDKDLSICPSKYYPKLNYVVINNFINFIREEKLKQILK